MEKLAQVQELYRKYASEYPTFVNLTGYIDKINHFGYTKPTVEEPIGTNVTIGQTFRTKKGETEITSMQLWVPYLSLIYDEKFIVNIWDSPEKKTLIGSTKMNFYKYVQYPTFYFTNTKVKEDTEYYWEIVQTGGSESIANVVRTDGDDWYKQGKAYVNGKTLDNADFFFFMNSTFFENYVEQWASKKPDMLSFDSYPFNMEGTMDDGHFISLEIVRRQALKYNLDIWSYMQSLKIGEFSRNPDEGDMRLNIYADLAYGVKGMIYFTYYTPDNQGFLDAIFDKRGEKTEKYEYGRNNNAELLQLGETLKQLTSLAVYHTGVEIPRTTVRLPENTDVQPADANEPYIISYFEHQNGDPYLMIVNRDPKTKREGTFTLKGKPEWVKEISKETGKAVKMKYDSKTGKLTLSFREGDGILLQLPSDYNLKS
jgi:hypothetical protein